MINNQNKFSTKSKMNNKTYNKFNSKHSLRKEQQENKFKNKNKQL